MRRRPGARRRGVVAAAVLAVGLTGGLTVACSGGGSVSTAQTSDARAAGSGVETSSPTSTSPTSTSTVSPAGSPAPAVTSGGTVVPAPPGTSPSTPTGTPPAEPTGQYTVGESAVPTAVVVGGTTLPPVPPTAEASFGEGLSVRVTRRETREVTATDPGEVSGPGVVLTLSFHNGSAAPVDLDGVRISAYDAAGTPAPSFEGDPARPPSGILPPGADAEATAVFSMDPVDVASMSLEITSTSSTDVIVLGD
ncbi:hypothetical protein [Kineococcus sp. NPDC059986]|uniref:hypothetical protein n=1 Tax=Kineococcus sp. NPDC059986 TaxID=3155538 RepID=UPI00344F57ED